MNIEAVLSERTNSSRRLLPPSTRLRPLRYSWTALGGPEQAELAVVGPSQDVWEAVEWLRCPVTLYDERAGAVWWGYVAEVEVSAGALRAAVSLDECYNRVKVGYVRDTDQSQQLTDWAADDASIATYGTIEYLGSMTSASDGLALEDARKIRSRHRYPLPVLSVEAANNPPEGRITCRGWYNTLAWRYYSNNETSDAAATTIIQNAISTHGQFFSGCDVLDAGTITRSQYYELGQTTRDVIEELLEVGVSGGNRLLATVTQERRLRVYQEPALGGTSYWLSARGQLLDAFQTPSALQRCPVGAWVRLGENIPPGVNASRMSNLTSLFVERSEYTPETGLLRLEPPGRPSPWGLVEVEE